MAIEDSGARNDTCPELVKNKISDCEQSIENTAGDIWTFDAGNFCRNTSFHYM